MKLNVYYKINCTVLSHRLNTKRIKATEMCFLLSFRLKCEDITQDLQTKYIADIR